MHVKHSERLDKTEPTLIVKYGRTTKKYLTLDRSGIILGKARGCDIELDAPDISPVHCVITRGPAGLYLRDCGSRVGTKINGAKVHEAVLHDGDVVLIGAFCFDVYLPWKVPPQDVGAASQAAYKEQLQRMERSRERLAALALSMRRRLHEERARAFLSPTALALAETDHEPAAAETLPLQRAQPGTALAERQAELARQVEELTGRLHAYEQKTLEHDQREQALNDRQTQLDRRARELEEAAGRLVEVEYQLEAETNAREERACRLTVGENRLEAETNALEEKGRRLVEIQAQFEARRDLEASELTSLRNHVARASQELTERRARFEEEQRRRECEQALAERELAFAQHFRNTGKPGLDPEEARRVELRGRELDCYARHLRRTAVTLRDRRRHLQITFTELLERLQLGD